MTTTHAPHAQVWCAQAALVWHGGCRADAEEGGLHAQVGGGCRWYGGRWLLVALYGTRFCFGAGLGLGL